MTDTEDRNPLRLVSWNVAGRVGRFGSQVEQLSGYQADIVALQETTARTIPMWRWAATEELGLPYIIDSRSLAPDQTLLNGPRKYAQVFASRFPLEALPPQDFEVPWPERVLSVVIQAPGGDIEAHTTHIPPGSSNGWLKIAMFEGIHARLARSHGGHRLLCGDFNMPRKELPDGTVLYWGTRERANGELGRRRPERWCAGERSVREGLAPFDLPEQYRLINGYTERADTWIPTQGLHANPRRFDHLYASKSLSVVSCTYDHQPRVDRLSDHSVLIADMKPDQ